MAVITVPIYPMKLGDGGFHLFVEIVAFRDKHWAVIDTGASRSVFDRSFIEVSWLDTLSTENTISEVIMVLPQFEIGNLKIQKYNALILDLNPINDVYASLTYPRIIAIIGSDLFYRYNALINYKKLEISFSTMPCSEIL